jgi:hypothetical protein
VKSEAGLLHAMVAPLGQENRKAALGRSAETFVAQNQAAIGRVMDILEPFFKVDESRVGDEVH